MAMLCVAVEPDSTKCFCSVSECKKPVIARGLCSMHWARWRKHGDPTKGAFRALPPTCEVEGCENEARIRKGGKAVCIKHEQRFRKYGSFDLPVRAPKPWAICTIEGCGKPARTRGANLCDMHYCRRWRNEKDGNDRGFDLWKPEENIGHSHGYLLRYCPDHPLRQGKSGPREYEHRVVFYDEHGTGPFSCHWCGTTVTWDDMHVDHVNGDKQDNDLRNLVSSCALCNQWRGREKMIKTTRERRATKYTFQGVTKTAAEWAEDLGIDRRSLKARIKAGWPIERALTEKRGPTGPGRGSGRLKLSDF